MFADLLFCNCLGLFMVAGAYSTVVKEAVFMGRLRCECFPCRPTSLQEPFCCVPSSPALVTEQSDGSPAGLVLREAWQGQEDAESRTELRPRRRGRGSGGARQQRHVLHAASASIPWALEANYQFTACFSTNRTFKESGAFLFYFFFYALLKK